MNARNMSMSVATVVALVVSGFGAANAGTLDQLSVQFLQGNEGNNNEGPNTVTTKPSRDIRIDIWTDVEEESLMQRGEEFTLSFQTNSDLYVVIYKIDVEGRAEVVWPSSRYSDGFVYGNHAYSIPRPGQPGRLRVGSVKGVEYVEAIASSYPFDLRALGIDFRFDSDDRSQHNYYIDGDPFLAVNDINYAITGLEEDVDYVVTDWLHLYVEEEVEYARYSCNQCHLDDSGYSTVTPYVDTCSQVQVRVDWGWYNSWYVSFGWYPLYYEPPFYYWDYYWSRPYWYAWYPVPYRWPGYGVYTRAYPVYWWRDSLQQPSNTVGATLRRGADTEPQQHGHRARRHESHRDGQAGQCPEYRIQHRASRGSRYAGAEFPAAAAAGSSGFLDEPRPERGLRGDSRSRRHAGRHDPYGSQCPRADSQSAPRGFEVQWERERVTILVCR